MKIDISKRAALFGIILIGGIASTITANEYFFGEAIGAVAIYKLFFDNKG
tara:strand:+ start:186 stop:335 length:150 start_codon:yes stop_codon:yes gene_type:complete